MQISRAMGVIRDGIGAEGGAKPQARRPSAPAGQSTQMIVGRNRRHRRRRFSQASPRSTPAAPAARVLLGVQSDSRCSPALPPVAPPLVREHRLYQADWLMRFYGFGVRRAHDAGRAQSRAGRWIRSWPGRCATASAFPGGREPRRPRASCCACPGIGVRNVRSHRRACAAGVGSASTISRGCGWRCGARCRSSSLADHSPGALAGSRGPARRRIGGATQLDLFASRARRSAASSERRAGRRFDGRLRQLAARAHARSSRGHAARRSALGAVGRPQGVLGGLRTRDTGRAATLAPRVSARFLAGRPPVACHRDPKRWSLLYRALWRHTAGEPHLLAWPPIPTSRRSTHGPAPCTARRTR